LFASEYCQQTEKEVTLLTSKVLLEPILIKYYVPDNIDEWNWHFKIMFLPREITPSQAS
jgi:hypothetical protein